MTITHILIILSFLPISLSNPSLSFNYYSKTCPQFDQIMQQTTTDKQILHPTTAAATLRLFFHDCFVSGCDASILITSTSSERNAEENLSLPGDAFDVIIRAKSALDLACPSTVSCTDILAVATRNLVSYLGGPYYPILLGRKDSLSSTAASVSNHIPLAYMSLDSIITMFADQNFSLYEMVALSGAHTVGFSHCNQFMDLVHNDSSYDPRLAVALDQACKGYEENKDISVYNDIMTPIKFDNMYFKNLRNGLGILKSDRALYSDPRTRPFVEMYAEDQDLFFKDFADAMQKMSVLGVKVGDQGEVRRKCDAFNNS